MTLGGEGVKGHDVINYNLWAGKNLHDSILHVHVADRQMAKQLKQTTLFGNVLQRPEAIYKNPQNTYERFVELWYQRARKEGSITKQGILKEAQVQYA